MHEYFNWQRNLRFWKISFYKYSDLWKKIWRLYRSAIGFYISDEIEFNIFEFMFVCPNAIFEIKKIYRNNKMRTLVKNCLKINPSKEEKNFFKKLKRGIFWISDLLCEFCDFHFGNKTN